MVSILLIYKKIELRKGNWRYTFSIINNIISQYNQLNSNNKLKAEEKSEMPSKAEVFKNAIENSEIDIREDLSGRIADINNIINKLKNNTCFILALAKSQLFVEYSQVNKVVITFDAEDLNIFCDFLHIHDVKITENDDEYNGRFFLYEPIIKEVLNFTIKRFSIILQKECTKSIPALCSDGSSQSKLFELICLYQLCHFNGILVSDLPFVKNIPNLPQWAQKTTLLAKLFGLGWEYFKFFNFDQLDKSSDDSNCYPDQNGNFYSGMLATEYDATFISQYKDFIGCVLKPQNLTRPDGFLPMITNDNKEIHPLLLGIKCYSSQLSNDIINDNTNTTDPDLLFTQSNNKNPKQTEKARRILYPTKEKKPLFQGSLRVHILLSPNEINNKSYVNDNGDILVYITKNNLNEFFDFKTQKYLKNYFNRLCSIIPPEQKQNSKKTNQSSQKKSTKRKHL